MSSKRRKSLSIPADKLTSPPQGHPQIDMPDDRYPGSFFRVPGLPAPGRTTWSAAK